MYAYELIYNKQDILLEGKTIIISTMGHAGKLRDCRKEIRTLTFEKIVNVKRYMRIMKGSHLRIRMINIS